MCENDIKENKESSAKINVRCGTSYWGFLGRLFTILIIVAIGVMIFRNMYVERKTYWEDNIDIDLATIHKEGEVVSTVGSFWGSYFVIKLEDGSFIKKDITEVTAVK